MSILNDIANTFGILHVNISRRYNGNDYKHFELVISKDEDFTITFDQLVAFSVLVGTKNINLNTEYEDGGGCPTCGSDPSMTARLFFWYDTENNPLAPIVKDLEGADERKRQEEKQRRIREQQEAQARALENRRKNDRYYSMTAKQRREAQKKEIAERMANHKPSSFLEASPLLGGPSDDY